MAGSQRFMDRPQPPAPAPTLCKPSPGNARTAETLSTCGEPPTMKASNILETPWPAHIPHDLRVGVQLGLMIEMVVGQRNEPDARGLQ